MWLNRRNTLTGRLYRCAAQQPAPRLAALPDASWGVEQRGAIDVACAVAACAAGRACCACQRRVWLGGRPWKLPSPGDCQAHWVW